MEKEFAFKSFNTWCKDMGLDPNSIKSVHSYKRWTALARRVCNA